MNKNKVVYEYLVAIDRKKIFHNKITLNLPNQSITNKNCIHKNDDNITICNYKWSINREKQKTLNNEKATKFIFIKTVAKE